MGFGVNRGKRDFSERERTILNLIRPHIVQAYRTVQIFSDLREKTSILSLAVEERRQGVVKIDRNGKIIWATVSANAMLQNIRGTRAESAVFLPPDVWRWVKHCVEILNKGTDAPESLRPFVIETASSTIQMRVSQELNANVLLLEERSRISSMTRLRDLGVSPREAEVLYWLAEGKSNAEIAMILNIALGTVKTHLERIYIKLGVDHRHAAMTKALAVLTSPNQPLDGW